MNSNMNNIGYDMGHELTLQAQAFTIAGITLFGVAVLSVGVIVVISWIVAKRMKLVNSK